MAGHPTYHVNLIKSKMRDYMDRRVTPPKRVTSPTWGPSPQCKQALRSNNIISALGPGLKTVMDFRGLV